MSGMVPKSPTPVLLMVATGDFLGLRTPTTRESGPGADSGSVSSPTDVLLSCRVRGGQCMTDTRDHITPPDGSVTT